MWERPRVGNHQVWELSIPPNGTNKVELTMASATPEEMAKVKEINAPVPEADMTILSPRNLQVFQRRGMYDGYVVVSGRVKPACEKVEARVTGTSLKGALGGEWQSVPMSPKVQSFSAMLATVPGGWYKVEVRATKGGAVLASASVERVGVGEVFVGAGQSNSTNCGQFPTQQTSGMVSSFSGHDWRIADDPQPGAHDQTTGGSFWPGFGDAMYAKYKVPIGVAVTGHGGTSVNQWLPDGELFAWMMGRIWQLGPMGFRAVLWHQGETDTGMSADEYAEKLTTVIRATSAAAGWDVSWVVAQVSYHSPEEPSHPTTREAQKRLWDTGVAVEGPDTDLLVGDNRDMEGKGIHFSIKGCKAHGEAWEKSVSVWLDKLLGE
jgi:hypothetical protein